MASQNPNTEIKELRTLVVALSLKLEKLHEFISIACSKEFEQYNEMQEKINLIVKIEESGKDVSKEMNIKKAKKEVTAMHEELENCYMREDDFYEVAHDNIKEMVMNSYEAKTPFADYVKNELLKIGEEAFDQLGIDHKYMDEKEKELEKKFKEYCNEMFKKASAPPVSQAMKQHEEKLEELKMKKELTNQQNLSVDTSNDVKGMIKKEPKESSNIEPKYVNVDELPMNPELSKHVEKLKKLKNGKVDKKSNDDKLENK